MISHTGALQYPFYRMELVRYLKQLADVQYQNRHWVRGEPTSAGTLDSFDFTVHFLFDDMDLENSPESSIGVFLYDEMELSAVLKVIAAINDVFDDIGLERVDADYVQSRLWPMVIVEAAAALKVLNLRCEGGDNGAKGPGQE